MFISLETFIQTQQHWDPESINQIKQYSPGKSRGTLRAWPLGLYFIPFRSLLKQLYKTQFANHQVSPGAHPVQEILESALSPLGQPILSLWHLEGSPLLGPKYPFYKDKNHPSPPGVKRQWYKEDMALTWVWKTDLGLKTSSKLMSSLALQYLFCRLGIWQYFPRGRLW